MDPLASFLKPPPEQYVYQKLPFFEAWAGGLNVLQFHPNFIHLIHFDLLVINLNCSSFFFIHIQLLRFPI